MAFESWLSSKSGVCSTWVLATSIGWALDAWGFTGFVGGLMLGVLQWLVLRKLIVKAWGWIIATAIAVPISGLATVVLFMATGDPSPPTGVIANVVAFGAIVFAPGAIVGTAQCLVLLGKVPKAGWWIGASICGMGLYQATLLQGREWLSNSPNVYLLALAVAAIASAIITGMVLVWLLQKRGQWSESK